MAQWGQGQQGFQYPMQTGFPGNNPQFQQNPQFQPQNPQFQPQNPQFQQQAPQFQQGGLGGPSGGGGILPQPTGFQGQRPPNFQQPQQTGFQGGSGFIQPQATGFPGGNFQQQSRPAPPPVPPIPTRFQQPNQQHAFLNLPPPQQQPNRLLSASPGFGGGLVPQPTGFAGRTQGPLVPQMTGFIDPRLQMMSQTFMPLNTSAPYNAGGVPQLPQQSNQSLFQSVQEYNQTQHGSTSQQLSWALTKAEKKKYDQIFRSWDAQGTGSISGTAALEVFGASGLPKDDLARIWTLADMNDRGKLNLAEFHVAMGLIYRRLSGMPIPDQLPQELVPPSAVDLDSTVDRVKELLKNDTRTGPANQHSFSRPTTSSSNIHRDASNYKHSDSEPPGGFYKPPNRHVVRSAVRSRDDDDTTADLSDMKRQLENTAMMLDRSAEENSKRTKEDEELEQEMEDLKYAIKRVREDLDYVSRGPKTSAKEEERRRLERELLSLMHERIPEVERKIKARDERKEKEKRQWARDRDRANDRFGRYDRNDYSRRDSDRDRPYSRNEDRDRPYSRNDDRDRPYSRGGDDRDRLSSRNDDRDRPYSRGAYDRDERDSYRRERSRSRDSRDNREYERTRSPVRARSPPAPPPAAPSPVARAAPATPRETPPISTKNMTKEERSAYTKAQAQRLIQSRMAALGVTAPSSSPTLDTSVEDRLQQEKKEAEEKAKAAEKQAEERERARKERLAQEKALHEDKVAPTPTPTSTAPVPAPTPAPKAVPTPKAAPPTPVRRGPAPPPPKPRQAVPTPTKVAPIPAAVPPPAPAQPEVDPEEEALRAQEEALRKKREERLARMRQLEQEEEEAAAKYEQERLARIEALKARAAKPPTPPPAAPPAAPPVQPATSTPVSPPAFTSPAEKSTNPFSRLINKEGANTPSSPPTSNGNGSTNPWSNIPAATRAPSVPPPSKSPAPKSNYHTASSLPEDDWDDVKEKEDSDDSSDDEVATSRTARANIAQQLFGGILPRPSSAAASSGQVSSPSSPAPLGGVPPPPPPPPAAPRTPVVVATGPPDTNALMRSIQGGMKLRPTKTVDKSAPPVSGKVLGDTAPPSHISNAPRPASPPRAHTPPRGSIQEPQFPAPGPMSNDDEGRSSNRQSVGWFADRAADAGATPAEINKLPSTIEADEEEGESPEPAAIPQIMVNEVVPEPSNDLMADIDKSIQHRVRTLYAFVGDGPDDLTFAENLIITANPSKSGGEWWYGTTVSTGKSGLFPKTYVEVVKPRKAKAVYSYESQNADELPFSEGDVLSIVDTSEEEWWKAEQSGVVFIVPAAYLEVVEESTKGEISQAQPRPNSIADHMPGPENLHIQRTANSPTDEGRVHDDREANSEDSDSDYLSFDESDDDNESATNKDKEARERERNLVLEAAGLIVNKDAGPPPARTRSFKRRPAPAAPRRTPSSMHKDLPPVPLEYLEQSSDSNNVDHREEGEAEQISHEARLDDAFARYESFKNNKANLNRLSTVSTESSTGMPAPLSPATTVSSTALSPIQGSVQEGRYSHLLSFLTGSSRSVEGERRTASTLNISAPIMMGSNSGQGSSQESPSRPSSPAFGMSWASLVDKNALDGIPPGERKRQEAIFELINTEVAYVRDLQLIVEVFYSSMLPLLSTKEITVVFANVEDILLTNTAFVSSLEERQKDCRLYVDKIADILLTHIPNMGVYMEYCVNQSMAIKVLQSLRDSNPELASHLQHLRDNPDVRGLDLSSYLLSPMQRITRYPLLIKQIAHYTELGEEYDGIQAARDMAEKLLDHINETIRDQENHETLREISKNMWIGQGRLDLTAPTRFMGPRKLLRRGALVKAKSGKKLHAFLCSDILVLIDDSMKNLYRMPIPLAHAQVKEVGSRDDTMFQISQAYPRGGDSISLRALSPRDCHQWVAEIAQAGKRARHAEERAARKAGRR